MRPQAEPAPAQDETWTTRLQELLTHGYEDPWTGEHQPGLLDWYPMVVLWTTVRSVGGAGGGRHAPLPLNADALDFCRGRYWADVDIPMSAANSAQLADPTFYRPGFELTALGLEASARRALGLSPRLKTPSAVGSARSDVIAALRWLSTATETLTEAAPLLASTVREEALRVSIRSRGMLWGARLSEQRSQCMYCHQVESVWSDEKRAVCITPTCRQADGSRHCWGYIDGAWEPIREPDVAQRGQVSDEQLQRWADTA